VCRGGQTKTTTSDEKDWDMEGMEVRSCWPRHALRYLIQFHAGFDNEAQGSMQLYGNM
jgi:hypothetical protein